MEIRTAPLKCAMPHRARMRSFASDNWSGAHPEVVAAIARANADHAPAYGDDEWTRRAEAKFREVFGERAHAFFVFNGTGANVVGLSALARPFEAVLCSEMAHIHQDECGAPERFGGFKLVPVATPDGKLTPERLAARLARVGDQHASQPRVVSLTQATELGTSYAPAEVRALSSFARENRLRVHMDGARLANAVAHLGCDVREVTVDAGVDVLSFGGGKNGALLGEAIVVFDEALARDLKFLRKQGMQLASKSRFIAAQFEALLTDGLWLRSARHANRMAQLLAREAAAVPGVVVAQAVQANEVFARLPPGVADAARREVPFYAWDDGLVRWVCSFDTDESDVRRLVSALRGAADKKG